jgi:galactonate dehydratase
MKITDIRSMRLVGPLCHGQGGSTDETCSKIVLRVDTDAGIHGLGELEDFMGVAEGVAYMREYFHGRDPMAIRSLVSELLYGTLPPHHPLARHGAMAGGIAACPPCSPTATPWGPVLWAASGLDIALCDLIGKALGTPAYNLLGGRFRPAARVYLDRSSPREVGNPDAWKRMAHEALEAGYTQLKFDVDYSATDVPSDVWNRSLTTAQVNRIAERLAAVRETVGPDFELCVDCHMQYNRPDAVRVAHALEPLNLLWLEDPCPITSPVSSRQVCESTSIPVCVGEMFSAEQFQLFLGEKACDILHPDVLFCGGLHEARRIADLAELHHLPVAFHGNGGCLATIAAAHAAVASRNFLGLEYHFIETEWVGAFVRRDVPLFENGHVPLTEAPGLGVELNREVCRRYLAPGEALL